MRQAVGTPSYVILTGAMKRAVYILILFLLSSCTSYNYVVKDGGDGVYYAESPPVYTYVDGYFGFPYFGPYSGYWYNPIWYSPLLGHHYSWYRPYQACGMPYYFPSHAFAGQQGPRKGKKARVSDPVVSAPPTRIILPVDLEQMTIAPQSSRYASKNPSFNAAGSKSRYAAKSVRSSNSVKRSSTGVYRPSSSYRSPSSSRYPSTPSRSQGSRHAPSRMVIDDDH